jgi:CRP-like cAMP-binding protein
MPVAATELAKLFPLDALRPETREQLGLEASVTEYRRNETIFNAGDLDEDTVYILDGEVKCTYPDGRVVQHVAGSGHGRYALNDAVPRRFTATVASSSVKALRLERRFVEKIIAWDQLSRDPSYLFHDNRAGANSWVFRLLQSHAFIKLPTGNLERMFQAFESVNVSPSEVIMREGDAPDNFYVIREGTAAVSKTLDGAQQVVAYLREGDVFGEDALLANAPRNATVRMLQGGRLMKLSKEAFNAVLKPPMVSWVLPQQAASMVQEGVKLVDVRMPEEFALRAIHGAANIPLYRLREDMPGQVAEGARVLVYCNTGERSAAAAFILNSMGYDVSALHGGLGAMLKVQGAAAAPA